MISFSKYWFNNYIIELSKGVLVDIGSASDTFLALSTTTLNYSNPIINRPSGGSYADVQFAVSDWIFYSGPQTGTANDSLVSLKNSMTFPTSTEDWGTISEVCLYRPSVGSSARATLSSEFTTPFVVSAGSIVVFLGSPIHGAGDISFFGTEI